LYFAIRVRYPFPAPAESAIGKQFEFSKFGSRTFFADEKH